MICIHRYSKWSKPYSAKRERPSGSFGDSYVRDVTMQERTCQKCGYIQARTIRDGKVS